MNPVTPHPLLAAIGSPADLRALPAGELTQVATELRQYLFITDSHLGGHFAAGLGTGVRAVALDYFF